MTWKYTHNPYLPKTLIYLALWEAKVVGMRGFSGAQWFNGHNDPIRCLCAGDLVIEPGHRNQGLVSKIMAFSMENLVERGFEFAFNLSGGPITQLSSLATGWKSIGLFDSYHCCPDTFGLASFETLNETTYVVGGNEMRLGRHADPSFMFEVTRQVGRKGALHADRSAEFYQWRFQNPLSEYRFLYLSGPKTQGYLVLQIPTNRKPRRVAIVDWAATDPAGLDALLELSIALCRQHRITIGSTLFQDYSLDLLKLHGFEKVKKRSGIEKFRSAVLVYPLDRSGCGGDPSTRLIESGGIL